MKAFRHSGLIVITLLLTILLVACGSNATQGTGSQGMNSGNTMNNNNNGGMTYPTPTTGGGMMYPTPTTGGGMMGATPTVDSGMMGGITITPDMVGNMGAFILAGKATINGNQVNVLMTNKGFAVYYYKPDTMFTATCTGQCAQNWPPVLAPQGMMTVSSSVTLPRQLSVHQTPNGAQVFYDGHALYTYAADKQANIATGRAQDMQWYLVGFTL